MSLSKLWNLMSKHTFVFSDESGHNDLQCVICANIMVNAVGSSVCGCHYCYNCISKYINGEEKCCPGGKQFCRDEIIKLGENAVKSNLLNRRISILNAKCPNESCEYYVELIKMEDHLRLCTKQPTGCPYVAIGCISEMSNKDEIVTHLHSYTMTHSELLIELIMNLKNEVCVLKDDFVGCKLEIDFLKAQLIATEQRNIDLENENETNNGYQNKEIEHLRIFVNDLMNELNDGFEKNKLEISFLKEDLSKKENIIVNLEGELREMMNEVNIRVNGEKEEREKDLEEQRRLIHDARTKYETEDREIDATKAVVIDLKRNFHTNNLEIKSLKEELLGRENRIATLEEELGEVKNEVEIRLMREREWINKEINEQRRQIEDAMITRENVATLVNDARKDIDNIRGDFDKIRKDKNIGSRITKTYNKLYPNIAADFVWRFDGVSKNMKKEMWSESFYSNNYKFRLNMYINGSNDYFRLDCHTMKGVNDERVKWPLKRSITLSIIDQHTLGTHKSLKRTGVFNRPTFDRGGCAGDYYLGDNSIKYSSIKDNSPVFANDSILVSCVISDP